MRRDKPRPRKERFAEIYGLATALINDYYKGGNKVFEDLEIFNRGSWVSLGAPRSYFSSADWKELTAKEKIDVVACEISDKLQALNFNIINLPEDFK